MSKAIELDASRGFVALPASIFDLEISPGAFRALTVLCNISNTDGISWASLDQLSDWVKRAKSSISAYLSELRAAGLVATESQTRRNGANYRLKIKVTFWADWVKVRTKSSSPAPQKAERRVQPVERPTIVKNKPIKKQDVRHTAGIDPDRIYQGWSALTRGVSFGQYSGSASPALLNETERFLNSTKRSPSLPIDDVEAALRVIWADMNVQFSDAEIRSLALRCKGVTAVTLGALCQQIAEVWRPHWKKPPSEKQFDTLVRAAVATDKASAIRKIIEGDYNRYMKGVGAKSVCIAA